MSDINIRLYSPSAAKPEPASSELGGLGLACAGLAAYLCQRRSLRIGNFHLNEEQDTQGPEWVRRVGWRASPVRGPRHFEL